MSTYTYAQDWALPADTKELKISWHVPTHEQLQAAEKVMSEFLQPQLDRLEEFMGGKAMSRWVEGPSGEGRGSGMCEHLVLLQG